jgi:hypothetical protein
MEDIKKKIYSLLTSYKKITFHHFGKTELILEFHIDKEILVRRYNIYYLLRAIENRYLEYQYKTEKDLLGYLDNHFYRLYCEMYGKPD